MSALHTNGLCPKPEVLKPCLCERNSILCAGELLNLKQIFTNISQSLAENEKHFHLFDLKYTTITELEENTFSDITFDYIQIANSTNLKLIHTNAFNSSNSFIHDLAVFNSPIVNSPPNHDIFHLIRSMINLRNIQLDGTQITEIPSNAFQPLEGSESQVQTIMFNKSPIKKIGNYSFYGLKNLTLLGFDGTSLEFISSNAFHFENQTNELLIIYLDNTKSLNGSSFDINSLSSFKRPTTIYMGNSPNIKFLDEKIFRPFFEADQRNKIVFFEYLLIDCDDCRSHWIVKEIKYLKRFDFLPFKCLNNQIMEISNSFKNCSLY
jgi:hypothetical protein